MAGLEEMARETRPIAENQNYTYGDTRGLRELIRETVEGAMDFERDGVLTIPEIERTLSKLVDSDLVTESRALLGLRGVTKKPIISVLQAGEFAVHILFNYQVRGGGFAQNIGEAFKQAVNPKSAPDFRGFVVCIARHPTNTPQGRRINDDFDNLKVLKMRFPPSAKYLNTVYKTVDPVHSSTLDIHDEEYHCYTTKFDDNAELACGILHKKRNSSLPPDIVPYLFHPTPNNKWERTSNRYAEREVRYCIGAYESAQGRASVKGNLARILFGNALVAVSLGAFPQDFSLNRGDWMGNFNAPGTDLASLTFVSTNGVMVPVSREAWINAMLEYTETATGNRFGDSIDPIEYKPFNSELCGFTRAELAEIYSAAHTMVEQHQFGISP